MLRKISALTLILVLLTLLTGCDADGFFDDFRGFGDGGNMGGGNMDGSGGNSSGGIFGGIFDGIFGGGNAEDTIPPIGSIGQNENEPTQGGVNYPGEEAYFGALTGNVAIGSFRTDTSYYPFEITTHRGYDCVRSTNQEDSTSSVLYYTVHLNAGEILLADVYVSSEEGCDRLIISMDDTELHSYSGTSLSEFATCEIFTAGSSGNYTFTFQYRKDSSVSYGEDAAYLKNLRVVGNSGNSGNSDSVRDALFDSTVSASVIQNNGYTFVATANGDVCSNNTGIHESTAVLELDVYLAAGDTLWVDYYVSSESGFDRFEIYVGGTQVQSVSGTSQSYFVSYEIFSAWDSGTYNVRFAYSKDGSSNSGSDCARLDNLRVVNSSEPQDYDLSELISPNLSVSSVDTNYSYTFVSTGNGYVRPENSGIHGSDAYVTLDIYLYRGATLCVDYYVSSESGCDGLYVIVDGNSYDFFSGTNMGDFSTLYIFTAETTGYYTVTFRYHKDGSVNEGSDAVYLKNLHVRNESY